MLRLRRSAYAHRRHASIGLDGSMVRSGWSHPRIGGL